MARISRQTRETIKTVLFLLVVAILILTYVVYPLNRSKALMGREDIDILKADSLYTNDPTPFSTIGLHVDSLRVEADGVAKLALLFVTKGTTAPEKPRGTVILIPDERQNRSSIVSLAQALVDTGFAVITYDQRASGLTTGQFHSDGQLEAQDLEAVITYFEIRRQIHHPLIVLGFRAGGDAAMLAEAEEKRIDGVVAVNPYLTTERMLAQLVARYDAYRFPFYRTTLWWWYGMRSGYAVTARDVKDITAVSAPTRLYLDSNSLNDAEVLRLAQLSRPEQLTIRSVTNGNRELVEGVVALVGSK